MYLVYRDTRRLRTYITLSVMEFNSVLLLTLRNIQDKRGQSTNPTLMSRKIHGEMGVDIYRTEFLHTNFTISLPNRYSTIT